MPVLALAELAVPPVPAVELALLDALDAEALVGPGASPPWLHAAGPTANVAPIAVNAIHVRELISARIAQKWKLMPRFADAWNFQFV